MLVLIPIGYIVWIGIEFNIRSIHTETKMSNTIAAKHKNNPGTAGEAMITFGTKMG